MTTLNKFVELKDKVFPVAKHHAMKLLAILKIGTTWRSSNQLDTQAILSLGKEFPIPIRQETELMWKWS
jgi:hypothetical protein